jgi:hypothetical protein
VIETPAIPGGYVLIARKLLTSELMDKPPHYLKLWMWMLLSAFWKEGGCLGRGQLKTSITEMQEVGGYLSGGRKCKLTPDEVKSAYRFLAMTDAIRVKKTTRGMVISISNYDDYQCPKNYENPATIQIIRDLPDATPDALPDTPPDASTDSQLTIGFVNDKQRNANTRTPQRIPRRKPAGPPTIDEEGKKNIKTSSAMQKFEKWFVFAFELSRGYKYAPQWGRDRKALKEMLESRDWKELVAITCRWFTTDDPFKKKNPPTIAGLLRYCNEPPIYDDPVLFRQLGLIPPEIVSLENWEPWISADNTDTIPDVSTINDLTI